MTYRIFSLLVFIVLLLPVLSSQIYAQTNAQTSSVSAAPKTVEEVLVLVNQYCSACHKVPSPNVLPKDSWPRVVSLMADLAYTRFGREFISAEHVRDITAFYYGSSPEKLPVLPYLEVGNPPLEFALTALEDKARLPLILNVNAVDFGRGKGNEFLVSDGGSSQLNLLRRSAQDWSETPLAEITIPASTQVVDYDGDGLLDIVVADLGVYPLTTELAGKIILLRQQASGKFAREILFDGLGRTSDVRVLDLDQDGDKDIAVAVFGGATGEIFWMENLGSGKHRKHLLFELSGALNVSAGDINGDGKVDLVSLIAQEHEMIMGFINQGNGNFKREILARAPHPMFGSTAMVLIDLDGDQDLDIVFTNGDAFDTQVDPKPYHGVQWLENLGNLKFQFHNIGRFYGAASVAVGDLDLDGDLDLVVGSWVNYWDDPKRHSMVWYENNGRQEFTPHPIADAPAGIVTIALEDVTGDGRPDIVAGSFRMDLFDKVLAQEKEQEQAGQPSNQNQGEKTAANNGLPDGIDSTLKPRLIFLENRRLQNTP